MIAPFSCHTNPVPPPRPARRTCTILACAFSMISSRLDEKISVNGDVGGVEGNVSIVIVSCPSLTSLADRYLQGLEFAAANDLNRDGFQTRSPLSNERRSSAS